MSRRTARHARPSRVATVLAPTAVGGALLLTPSAAHADGLLPGLLPTPSPSPSASPFPSPASDPEPTAEPAAEPTARAAAPRAAAGFDADATRALQRLVDRHRAALGLPALVPHAGLAREARRHSADMAADGRLRHADALFTRARKAALGLRLVGENVTRAADVDSAFRSELDSPHHRDVLETAAYRAAGLAVVRDGAGTVWVTVDLGAPTSAASRPAARPAASPAAGAHGDASRASRSRARAATARPVRIVPVPAADDRALARHLGPVPEAPVLAARLRPVFADAPRTHAPARAFAVPARRQHPAAAAVAAVPALAHAVTASLVPPPSSRGGLPVAPPLLAGGLLVLGVAGLRAGARQG